MATRKILVVDDLAANRQILKKALCKDYTILEAASGEEALDVLLQQHESISAVLLDIVMPGMDGFEILEKIRSSSVLAQIPVIMITSSQDAEARSKSLMLGANDFVTKPYNPDIIKHCLRNNIAFREISATVNALQRDRLTGLYSRETFFEKVQEMISAKEPGYYVMACFDIEKFKVINDQYGTKKGDEVLQHIAGVFREGFTAHGGICCRISADDFAVLYPCTFSDSAELKEIRKRAGNVEGLVSPVIFTIGRYVVNDLSLSPSAMYDRAMLAADSIKGRYDTKIAVYDESMRDHLIYEQEIVTEMETALSQRQFEPWFQPQYNHSTGALVGAEALVRWQHPKKGLVLPGAFVPVFEKNGFIYMLDRYIWEEVCKYLRKWLDQGRTALPVSINLSRYDLFRTDIVSAITGLVDRYHIPVELLRLEITESAFVESTEHIAEVVRQLVDYGFTLEIDDFGSGYSSLNVLKDVPAQVIKLDMRFLESSNSQRGGNIVESVVRMAKWLGMSVIAEGVETIEQADYLRSIGCNYLQGYLYAKPLPAEAYEQLCSETKNEERLLTLETVENLDNNSFWDPKSMDTLIFNSYVGGACIYEYYKGNIELLRATEKYAQVIGSAGMTVEDALKLNWAEHLEESSGKRVMADLEASVATKKEVTGEYVFLDLPGCPHETYLRSTMRVIASAGDRYLVYCTNENITAQIKAEQREQKTAMQLQAVMDNVNCGVSAVLLDGEDVQYLLTNDRYYALLGYTRQQYQEEIGNNVGATIHPEDNARVFGIAGRVCATGEPEMAEYRLIRRDGSLAWMRSFMSMTTFQGVDRPVQLSILLDVTERHNALERLRISEEENNLAVQLSGNIICKYNVADRSLTMSQDIAANFSLPERMEDVPYGPVREGTISPESADVYIKFFESILHGCKDGVAMFQQNYLGGWRWLEARSVTVFSDTGQPVKAVIAFLDITELLEKEAVYRKWKQSLEEKTPESYTLFRCNLSKNASFDTMEGSLLKIDFDEANLSFDERTKEYVEQCVLGEDQERYTAFLNSDSLLAGYYRGKRVDSLEYRESLPEGNTRWLRLSIDLIEYPNSTDVGVYLMYENIDHIKQTELQTKELAENDPLTRVLNRVTFAARVEQMIADSGPDTRNALLMLDIDGFKQVNDVFGHMAGDQTLVDIADALRAMLRRGDLLGRLGGDEFLIFLQDVPDDMMVAHKAKQICAIVRRSFSLEVQISGSVGITISPQDGVDFSTLYKKADSALYYVKGSGKDNYVFYHEDMEDEHLAPEADAVGLYETKMHEKKRRMLIVDDDVIDYALLANIFRDEFIIEKAKDGNSALVRLRHYGSAISAVLLDLNMPGLDGFAVLEKMQNSAELRGIPVVVVSADESRETCLRAIRCGARDFITKPVEPDILRIRVHSAVSKAENERLRAKNNLLELQKEEKIRYETALEGTGVSIIEYNWISGEFLYYPLLSKNLFGTYDDRKLWHILLSDMVADTLTVQKMQGLVHSIAEDRERLNGSITVRLKTPAKVQHTFRMDVHKLVNEYQLTNKLIITLIDLEHKEEA